MNNYSLGAAGSRWWWAPTGLGAAGAVAVAAILILPAVAYDTPAEPVSDTTVVVPPVTERPCFMWRAPQGPGWDGFQPTCPLDTDTHEPAPDTGRPGLDHRP